MAKLKVWINKEGNLEVDVGAGIAPVDAIEIEVEQLDRVEIRDNAIYLLTDDEYFSKKKQQKLQELKQYVANLLSRTDWVITKINSLNLEGQPSEVIQKELQKYQAILQERASIRQWNEQTKTAIQNAQTLEELQEIKIEFTG